MVTLKSKREIDQMKESGAILAGIHKQLREIIKPGITTKEIDQFVQEKIEGAGATAAQINSKFIARQQTALNVKLFMQKLTASPTRLPNMPSPTNMTNSWLPSVPTEQMPTPVSTLLATRKISPAIRLTTGQKFRQNVLKIA